MDYRTRYLLRRYYKSGDFTDFLAFAAQLERAGQIPPGSVGLIQNEDWSAFYNIRAELLEWPGALHLLEFLFLLPDDIEMITDNNLKVGMGTVRTNLIYIIVEAGGEEFLLRSIQFGFNDELITTHALHAVPRFPPGLSSSNIIAALRQLIQTAALDREVASRHVQSAATSLAVMGTPKDIDVMVDFIMSFDDYPGWTPIHVLESIAVLGKNQGIDTLMYILENNPIRGIVEYGSRALSHAIIWYSPARIPEGIQFFKNLIEIIDQHPTGTYHDRSGIIQAIGALRRNQRPIFNVYGWQSGWSGFLDLLRRRTTYWQARRAQRRLRERNNAY